MKSVNQGSRSTPEGYIKLYTSGRFRIVKQQDIVFLQSDNSYTRIFLGDGSSILMCRTLKDYEVELNDPHFLRCHKSYIVNRLYIKEIVKDSQNYMLLSNGTQIPIARRKSIHIVNSLL